MEIRSNIYRTFSALVLILFVSSIALPGVISAAGLLCQMNMAEMHNHASSRSHMQHKDHMSIGTPGAPCSGQDVCFHKLPQEREEVEAVAPTHTKISKASFLPPAIPGGLTDACEIPVETKTIDIRPTSPPLFLLNSTFLN